MTSATTGLPAHAGGTLTLGGDLPVPSHGVRRHADHRVPASGARPQTTMAPLAVLRRRRRARRRLHRHRGLATGPFVSEDLIAEALHPYPDALVIATKGGAHPLGARRLGGGRPARVPAPVRRDVAASAPTSSASTSDQFHRVDPQVPIEDVGRRAEASCSDQGKDPSPRPRRT